MKGTTKNNKVSSNKGTLKLGELKVELDSIDITIDILEMSKELKAEVDKAIETQKAEALKKYNEKHKEKPIKWSDAPTQIVWNVLLISLNENTPIEYSVNIAFNDINDEFLDGWLDIPISLTGYEEELKKHIIKTLVNRFF